MVGGRLTDSTLGFSTSNFKRMPLRPKSKDSPTKLASRMKCRWRLVLTRKSGEVLGTVAQAAEKVAAIQFELDEFQRRRLLVQELAR